MKYHHLTQEERYSNIEIGKTLKRAKTTIGRELARNKGQKGYRPKQAEGFAKEREQSKKRTSIGEETIAYIKAKIKLKWSPEQISGRIKMEGLSSVSHETIYKYLQKDTKTSVIKSVMEVVIREVKFPIDGQLKRDLAL